VPRFKDAWSYTFTSPYVFMAWYLVEGISCPIEVEHHADGSIASDRFNFTEHLGKM
jgi:hypothetical protein